MQIYLSVSKTCEFESAYLGQYVEEVLDVGLSQLPLVADQQDGQLIEAILIAD